MSPGGECQAGVKCSGRSSHDGARKRVEQCLASPILQSQVEDHLLPAGGILTSSTYSLTPRYLSVTSLSLSLLHLTSPDSFPLCSLHPKYPPDLVFSFRVSHKPPFGSEVSCSQASACFILLFLIWSGWQTTQPWDTAGIHTCPVSSDSILSFPVRRSSWTESFQEPPAFHKLESFPTGGLHRAGVKVIHGNLGWWVPTFRN